MLLEIIHNTEYIYEPSVEIAQHISHLIPRESETQTVISSELIVDPNPDWKTERIDFHGNQCNYFSIQSRHSELLIHARSVIETKVAQTKSIEPKETPEWEKVQQFFQYHSNSKWDAASEFLFTSPYVILHNDFIDFARKSFTTKRPILEASIDLMKRIYSEFKYEGNSTEIDTPAHEALLNRKGVCQDFAHIYLSCLRSIGLPAKYISGYLLTTPPPGQPRLIGSDASHAWVSVYIPQLIEGELSIGAWYDIDPTNNRWGQSSPGEDYVFLAQGRDYADVSPIRGVIHGGGDHQLEVAVTVRPFQESV